MRRVLVLLAALVAGCSGAADGATDPRSFPEAPLEVAVSDSGRIRVEVRTSPAQPPLRGEVSVQFVVVDETTGEPAADLSLEVVPWMPAMGHGTSIDPEVEETSPGTYVVSRLELFMPGTWQLRTTAGDRAHPITFAPSLDIP